MVYIFTAFLRFFRDFLFMGKTKETPKNDVSLLYDVFTLLIALHTVEGILESYSLPNVCLAALLYNIEYIVGYYPSALLALY